MLITRLFAAVALCLATSTAFAQTIPIRTVRPAAATAAADESSVPKLEHFDAGLVDKTLDPCDDFYKYSCNKWLTANPIPADQVYWSTGSGLELWNEGVLRDTLEAASKNDASRGPVQQKIGDYWAACMDESGMKPPASSLFSLNSRASPH
jgi:endothelin-converting enzyme/putative endopeptidase